MRVKLSVLWSSCVTAVLVGTPGLTVPREGHWTPDCVRSGCTWW